MSGGFQEWSLIPAALVSPVLTFERMMPALVRRHLSFRRMVVVERL
jgi:hypothetical protein